MQSQVSSLHKSHYRQQSQIESKRISEEKSVEAKGGYNVTLNFDSSDESDGGENKHAVKQDSCLEVA